MEKVPLDVVRLIVARIDWADLLPVRLTCKLFNRAASSDAFWRLFLAHLDSLFFSVFRGQLARLVGERFCFPALEDGVRQCDCEMSLLWRVHDDAKALGIPFEKLVRSARVVCDLDLAPAQAQGGKVSSIGFKRGLLAEKQQCTTLNRADGIACLNTHKSILEESVAVKMFYQRNVKTYWLYDGDSFKLEKIVDPLDEEEPRKWMSLVKNDLGRPQRTFGFQPMVINGFMERVVYPEQLLMDAGVSEDKIKMINDPSPTEVGDVKMAARIGGFPIEDPQGSAELQQDEGRQEKKKLVCFSYFVFQI
jgi:hypothetical protein